MMNHSGTFIRVLDLGELGEHEAVVSFRAYVAARPDVDDYNEMDIEFVTLDLGGALIDVLPLLDLEELSAAAWDEVPSEDDIAQERADARREE